MTMNGWSGEVLHLLLTGTTRNKRQLEQVVGRTSGVEIAGQPEDLRRMLKAVEAAGISAPAH
jgi:hypothetical protein